jgi:hypothetical protein
MYYAVHSTAFLRTVLDLGPVLPSVFVCVCQRPIIARMIEVVNTKVCYGTVIEVCFLISMFTIGILLNYS